MRNRIISGVVIAVAVLAAVMVWRPASGAPQAGIIGNPDARYVLTPVQGVVHQDVGNAPTNTVIKMDSVTGDTWVLHPQGWKQIKTAP